MPTYNFTVRAADDTGAYSDRDFSINVRNSVVDRFMLLTGTSAYGSPNLSEWTQRPNITTDSFSASHNGVYGYKTLPYMPFTKLIFNNGRWITYTFKITAYTSSEPNIHLKMMYSEDGINWFSINALTIDGYQMDLTTSRNMDENNKYCTISRIIKHKNMLYSIASYYIGDAHVIRVVKSEDGVNWQSHEGDNNLKSMFSSSHNGWLTPNYGFSIIGNSFYYNYSVNNRTFIKSTDLTGTEWISLALPVNINNNVRLCDIYYYNGMYIVFANSTTYYTSVDGYNWVSRPLPTLRDGEYPHEIIYGNGALVLTTFLFNSTVQTSRNKVYTSSNGIDWTERLFDNSFGSISSIYGSSGSSYPGIIKYNVIFSNGRFVLGSSTRSQNSIGGLRISYDGITWTTITENAPLTVSSIAALNP